MWELRERRKYWLTFRFMAQVLRKLAVWEFGNAGEVPGEEPKRMRTRLGRVVLLRSPLGSG